MTTDNRYGSEPLGKSVEEVEAESGNTVNSPVPGEDVRRAQEETLVVPAVVSGNASGVPAVVNPSALVDDGGREADRRTADSETPEE